MTKYSFLMLAGEKEGFLEQLQELGVVDITRSTKPIDDSSSEMMEKIAKAKKTLDMLDNINYAKDSDLEAIQKAEAALKADSTQAQDAAAQNTDEQNSAAQNSATQNTVADAEELIALAERSAQNLNDLKTTLAATEKEMKARLPWGEYDRDRILALEGLGYKVRWYCTESKRFDPTWAERYPLQIVQDEAGKTWFVTIAEKDAEYDFPLQECAAPAGTYAEALSEKEKIQNEMIGCKAGLLKAKNSSEAIKASCHEDMVNLDRYLADAACGYAAENMVSVITGFAPAENEAELCQKFDELGVFYLKEEAVEEDNPPIKLKNNWFARQFEVLTGMYGMPVYSEFDPTCILAPFFLLFFAMCMGDAGYGLVLILFGIGVKKNWINISMFKGLGNIITILGVGTLIVGTFLGTAFGIPLTEQSWVPQGLKNVMITGNIGGFDAQMLLALGIGVFHICLAMTVKAICYTKRFGFKNTVSTWGWLLLILGGIITASLAFLNVMSAEAIKWTVIAIGSISALGIFIFNTPGRNPLLNIGSGLWDTYNMATGILGDVLSYIRLYALGLAGGMLGGAFNDLGAMVLGDNFLTWIPYVLILLLGHTLNIAMSALGAFVHPLRLTFVEYFKNSGYEGKGAFYNPLTKTKQVEE